VDGVDPLLNSYGPYPGSAGPCVSGTCPAGTIPTPGNGGLGSVTLANVADGSYPIWSFLRLVCTGSGTSTACAAANGLTTAAQSFVTFGAAGSQADLCRSLARRSSTRTFCLPTTTHLVALDHLMTPLPPKVSTSQNAVRMWAAMH